MSEQQASITNGIIYLDLYHYGIVINGRLVDECYGTHQDAEEARREWLETLALDPEIEDCLGVPFNELPDSYFKNGHVKPLTLKEFEAAKAEFDQAVKAASK